MRIQILQVCTAPLTSDRFPHQTIKCAHERTSCMVSRARCAPINPSTGISATAGIEPKPTHQARRADGISRKIIHLLIAAIPSAGQGNPSTNFLIFLFAQHTVPNRWEQTIITMGGALLIKHTTKSASTRHVQLISFKIARSDASAPALVRTRPQMQQIVTRSRE